jgi:DivIVA domain-containing protein
MPLSPDDVQNKRFTVVRFKFGYDEEEVDNFLDEIEEELRRLISENRSLHQAATRAPGAPSPTAVLPPASPMAAVPPPPPPPPPPVAAPPPPPPPAPIAIPELAGLSGLADTDDASLRTLMLAQRTAEDAIAKAHADAAEILAAARAKATTLEQELRSVHATRLAALEKERSGLVQEITALRGFEREFRSRLRSYLQSTIGDLDARPSVEPAPAQPVAAAQAAAEAQSVGRHSAPLPSAAGAGPSAAGAGPSAAGAGPSAARPAPADALAAAAAAAAAAAGAQPSTQQPGQPPAQPAAQQPPPAQPGPPAQASAPPPAAVPPVAPPATPPPPPPSPFSSTPPPTGPPAQA